MKVGSSYSKCLEIVVFVTSFVFMGCFQSVQLTQAMIENSNEEDIVVSLRDGRKVSFGGQKYNLDVDENGRRVLRGKGKQYHKGESQFTSFDGAIPLESIEKITTSEKTSMFYIVIIGSTVAVGCIVLFLTALDGRGFGG
ncbi:MAG: hypothetical protein HY961_02050 [Ignavibacteriae bacterium]|nr:hypothetical protein [Ignavibacteriota bacterium]